MTEPARDPVEQLASALRRVDASLPDTQRARGAQALFDRLRQEAAVAPPRPRQSRGRWQRTALWSSVGAAAAAALVGLWLRRERPSSRVEAPAVTTMIEPIRTAPEPEADEGIRAILRPANRPGSEGGRARLETGPGQEAQAWLADCGRVVLRGDSVLAVDENTPGGISLYLLRGTLLVSFDRDAGRELTVRTPDARVRVTGTIFAVATGKGPTRVSVSRGSVEVTAGPLPVSVAAGKSWQVGESSLSAPDPETAFALRELRNLDAPRPVTETGRPLRGRGPVGEGASTRASPPAPASSEPTEEGAESIYRAAEAELAAGRTGPARQILESLVAKHPADPLAVPAAYELGRLFFAAKDYGRAGERLRWVRDNQRSAAAAFREPATFLLCRTELDSGDRRGGIACLERFRAAFPNSAQAGDALAVLTSIRLVEKDCERGKALLEEYLRRFPSGIHVNSLKESARACSELK